MYKLEVSEQQAEVLREACELYARVLAGQLDQVDYVINSNLNLESGDFDDLRKGLRSLEKHVIDKVSFHEPLCTSGETLPKIEKM